MPLRSAPSQAVRRAAVEDRHEEAVRARELVQLVVHLPRQLARRHAHEARAARGTRSCVPSTTSCAMRSTVAARTRWSCRRVRAGDHVAPRRRGQRLLLDVRERRDPCPAAPSFAARQHGVARRRSSIRRAAFRRRNSMAARSRGRLRVVQIHHRNALALVASSQSHRTCPAFQSPRADPRPSISDKGWVGAGGEEVA